MKKLSLAVLALLLILSGVYCYFWFQTASLLKHSIESELKSFEKQRLQAIYPESSVVFELKVEGFPFSYEIKLKNIQVMLRKPEATIKLGLSGNLFIKKNIIDNHMNAGIVGDILIESPERDRAYLLSYKKNPELEITFKQRDFINNIMLNFKVDKIFRLKDFSDLKSISYHDKGMRLSDAKTGETISSSDNISFELEHDEDMKVKIQMAGMRSSDAYYDKVLSQFTVEDEKDRLVKSINNYMLSQVELYKKFGKSDLNADVNFSIDSKQNPEKPSYLHINDFKFTSDYFSITSSGKLEGKASEAAVADITLRIEKYKHFADFITEIMAISLKKMLLYYPEKEAVIIKIIDKQKPKLAIALKEIAGSDEGEAVEYKITGKYPEETTIGKYKLIEANQILSKALQPDQEDLKKLLPPPVKKP